MYEIMPCYLAVFQHDFSKGIANFPLCTDVLKEIPEVESAFLMNNERERLWEVTEVDVYRPIGLSPFYFDGILIIRIGSLELPSGFDYRDYANIDIPSMMPHVEYVGNTFERSKNVIRRIPFFKNGRVQAEEDYFLLDVLT